MIPAEVLIVAGGTAMAASLVAALAWLTRDEHRPERSGPRRGAPGDGGGYVHAGWDAPSAGAESASCGDGGGGGGGGGD